MTTISHRQFTPTVVLFLLTIFLFGQTTNHQKIKLSYTDSLLLDSTWKEFVSAIETKQSAKIKSLSFRQIDCDMCLADYDYKTKGPPDNYLVPVDTFINHAYRQFLAPTTKLWTAIKTNKYSINVSEQRQWTPLKILLKENEPFIVFEIFFVTYDPTDRQQKEQGGITYLFAFVKTDGKFKFLSMGTIP